MMLRPNTPSRAFSCGPKRSEKFASGGARNSSANALSRPPQVEATTDSVRASLPSPFCVIACPSHDVATLAGVPGVLMSTAEIEPP